MAKEELGIIERAALLTLMAEAREIPNAELRQVFGIRLTPEQRERLNDRELLFSRKEERRIVHELTDGGWLWCAAELEAQRPPRSGSMGTVAYALLAGVGRHLKRSGLRLADVFDVDERTPSEPASRADVEGLIKDAYRRLASEENGWVSLTRLRSLIDDVPRAEVDATLRQMYRSPLVNIVAEADQRVLTPEDRESAVKIGGQDKHLLAIESA
jgi:hypothetical protein